MANSTKNVDKTTKKQMKSVREFLSIKAGGTIPDEWEILLEVLQDNLSLYHKVTEELNNLDALVVYTQKGAVPTPLLKIQNQCTINIKSICEQFGLSLKSGKKMDIVEAKKSETALDKFLKKQVEER